LKKDKVYFVSDLHLGIPTHDTSLERERLLVKWLEEIKPNAAEIFLMGDLFDFWFEYKAVVPKGYVRFLGKLAEITDSGIPVHVFKGNHDLWAFDYLEKEVGVKLYRKPQIRKIFDKTFYLAHGDGLGPGDKNYKFLKSVFEFKPNQFLFRWLHPDLGARMGNFFSQRSRLAKMDYADSIDDANFEKEKEMLYHYSLKKIKQHPDVEYFVFGHRHIPIIIPVNESTKMVILGDWLSHFSYGVFDMDGKMTIDSYSG